ncbi:MAG: PmoA family protein [Planctomyces sp.]
MTTAICFALIIAQCFPGSLMAAETSVAGGKVEAITGADGTIDIQINSKPFATFNTSKSLPKPFLLPVRTEAGIVMNRALGDTSDADHPHHKGLWLSIDEVNGQRFWAEKAKIVNTSAKSSTAGDSIVLEVENDWVNSDGTTVELHESTRITIHPNRLLSYNIRLTATDHEVTFDDTKEGLLGFRVAPSMKEKNGGSVVSSDGSRGTKDCWGKTFSWIDYYGTVEGKIVGVTLMDHPGNFRPSRYHVRDYGLFSISPFGEHAYTNGANEAKPHRLAKGESVNLIYGVYFHDGDTTTADVAGTYEKFLKSTQH